MGQGLLGAEIVRPCTFQTLNGESNFIESNYLSYGLDIESPIATPIQIGGASFGSIYVASTSGATGVVSLLAAFNTDPGNAGPVYDEYGTAITYSSLTSGAWYQLPAAALSVPYLWLQCANNVTIRVLPYLKG